MGTFETPGTDSGRGPTVRRLILGTQLPDAVAFAKTFIQQHFNPKTIVETTGPDQGADWLGDARADESGTLW